MDKTALLRTGRNWDHLGQIDPMWAILTDPSKFGGRWSQDEFFAFGLSEIDDLMCRLGRLDSSIGHARALDFGSGIGRLSRALCHYYERVDGVDVAPSMIEAADKHNPFPERCAFHLNVAADLSLFADDTFDLIYSNIVLQHIPPRLSKRYLREFERCCKPGGLIVFQLPHVRLMNYPSLKRYVLHGVYRLLPKRLITWYRRRKHAALPQTIVEQLPKIPMAMHSIRRQKVEALLRRSTLLSLKDTLDNRRDPFVSYMYVFRKRAH